MKIDFFNVDCKTTINDAHFGLCDEEKKYAFIDIENQEAWIGEVKNKSEKEIDFMAIDKCLNIRDENGNQESTCDCLLKYENNLIFIELKSWRKGNWVKTGREQITRTISLFKKTHTIADFTVKAHVCNNRKPYSHTGQAVNIQKFKDDTGFLLETRKEINIA